MKTIRQISVFVENKPGRLSSITQILKENDINIRALSIADTRDFGILRIIATDPDKACAKLRQEACTVTLTEVVAISIDDEMGKLSDVMTVINDSGMNVEYMYALATKNDDATIVIKTSNAEEAALLLQKEGAEFLTSSEI